MLCVVIKGPSLEEAHQQIREAHAYADIVELRLDYFTKRDRDAVQKLREACSLPMILTLRSQAQGGNYPLSEEERLAEIQKMAALRVEYLDVESHVPEFFIHKIAMQHPETTLIISHHDFIETPKDLDGLVQGMPKAPNALYKIATTARNSVDALRLLCWEKKQKRTIAIAMGYYGQISRILGKGVGSPITYASVHDDQSSLGQLDTTLFIERYRYRELNPHTAIYGLIGDPVDRSISDVVHNHFFAASGMDAVYVKMALRPEEIGEFLQLATQVPFCGLSVTMPLKERIMEHLDQIDPEAHAIGAVNTILFSEGKTIGYNTDGKGALNAIEQEQRVAGKEVLIIGAGGAAKAIAYEAYRRGALVTIMNRTIERAHRMARHVPCSVQEWGKMPSYDILINTTPLDMPIAPEQLLPGRLVMDCNTRANTGVKSSALIQCAVEKKCPVVYGYQMFIEQAIGQYALWFNNDVPVPEARNIMVHRILAQ